MTEFKIGGVVRINTKNAGRWVRFTGMHDQPCVVTAICQYEIGTRSEVYYYIRFASRTQFAVYGSDIEIYIG